MNSRWLLGLFLLIMGGALALRVPHLDLRPMHGDEAVHAVKFNDLWSHGQYQYDPREYHGPVLYDFAIPLAKITGVRQFSEVSATTLRLVPVLFGIALIACLWFLRDGFGPHCDTILWAALFTALSPVFVFYARYFIQETPLVFFTLALIACLWRARQSETASRRFWLAGAGMSAGLMLASKETALIAFFSIGLSWFCTLRIQPEQDGSKPLQNQDWFIMPVCGIGVSLCLLSNFGRSFPDLSSLNIAASTYLTRAGGGESQGELHLHPWFQYFEWLFWYRGGPGPRWNEAFIALLALVGLVAAYQPKSKAPLARFFAIYTVTMMVIYCLIPYKTPWCVLGFWQGATLLGGFGASKLLHLPTQLLQNKPVPARLLQTAAILTLSGGCFNLYQQARLANDRFFADRRNPWVYAHPTRDVQRLGERVQVLTTLQPTQILVIAPHMDYWPLPWELRAQNQVGFFDKVPLLPNGKNSIIIAAKASLPQLKQQLGAAWERDYHIEYYGLRPGVVFGLCVPKPLWQKFLDKVES